MKFANLALLLCVGVPTSTTVASTDEPKDDKNNAGSHGNVRRRSKNVVFVPPGQADGDDASYRSLQDFPSNQGNGQGNNGQANGNGQGNGNGNGNAYGKGKVMAQGNFGKVDMSSKASAQAGAKGTLEGLSKKVPGASGKEKFVPVRANQGKNSKELHMRFVQEIAGMPVEGAAMVAHTDEEGVITAINGEFVSDLKVATEPSIAGAEAINIALGQSRVPEEAHSSCTPPVLTVVRNPNDGLAYLAYKSSCRYDTQGEDGYDKPFRDEIFASATTGELITTFSKIYNALSMETQDCNQSTATNCPVVSNSAEIVNTGDKAIDSAHNYAIATYNYYSNNHGRDSIDDAGMTLITRVHYGSNYNNAFWDGSRMTYGDGDGVTFIPLSQDADVVAHELTHGVTERTSGLIYQYESGALNEAMSDIFGAMVDRQEGATGADIWLLGEDIYTPGTPGDGLRDMACPSCAGDYDYYPTRYIGTSDNGGVHWNSGIANLAFKLLVEGGEHPQGATSVNVPGIDFEAAADIFYAANVGCLTPSSNFAAARYCTADVHGGSNAAAVHLAWDAVGVPNDPPPPPPPPIDLTDGQTLDRQTADTGNVQQYALDVAAGSTVSCSTNGRKGDADLYLRFGEEAEANSNSNNNECGSYSSNSNERCETGAASSATTLYAAVHAFSGYSRLSITCTCTNCNTDGGGGDDGDGGGGDCKQAGVSCSSNAECCSRSCNTGRKICK